MAAAPVPYIAYRNESGHQVPPIVLQYDAASRSGANWTEVSQPQWHDVSEAAVLGRCAHFIRDGLKRMTGEEFPILSKGDLSKGIVLTLLKNASPDIRKDPEVQSALKENPADPYAANEAFYIRSEKSRVLIVARTADGLAAAAAELLESVDYEVLGMGPHWIYAPNYRNKPLVFNLKRAGRPSFYIRQLWAHSGQFYGVGTIMGTVSDPDDEPVDVSGWRWNIGTRLYGKSMAPFAGHALQAYHRKVLEKMRETGSTQGFYAVVGVGPAANRPAPTPGNKDHWWINTDAQGNPGYDKIAVSDGKEWKESPLPQYFAGGNIDITAPIVHQVVFEDMKRYSETQFKAKPDDPANFPTEVEDGGVDDEHRLKTMARRNWYPDYLAKEKLPFGRPYALHGYRGIDQPREIWDPASNSDLSFALAGYLLHEYDKWIDSLPKEQQVTATGKSKKKLIRCDFQSYNYNDVPPNFNPDQRIRIGIAPFPKHRGIGKWEKLHNQEEMAKALHIMLPAEPSSDYGFYSFSYYGDGGPGGIPAIWDQSSNAIAASYRRLYTSGYRAIYREIDYNFGKNGLGYYLAAKMLWNVNLTAKDLDTIRDRWLRRAYGSAWKEMKAYHDFMLVGNYPVNGPNSWAKAIRLIDEADKKIDGALEPAAERRIDDVKQYWYVHFLMDSGNYTVNSPEVKEFLWKGQMSYMVGMQGLIGRDFNRQDVRTIVGPEISSGPAHYTHAETQAWWPRILELWKVTPVSTFKDAILANGKAARSVDVNDLVLPVEFQTEPTDAPFLYNSAYMKYGTFLMQAGQRNDALGFKLTWPFNPRDSAYDAKRVPYGVDIWNPERKIWEPWIDKTTTTQTSTQVKDTRGRDLQVVAVRLKAPRAGVYRFELGTGGNLSVLANPNYDSVTDKYGGRTGFTYFNNAEGLTQSGVYVYIPRGTRSLDLEVWDTGKYKFVTFFKGLPVKQLGVSRKVDISAMGAHTIPLQPGEDGSLALIEGSNFYFPYLHSVPGLWAKSPAALLVPRAIAEADGLTFARAPASAAKQ